MSDLPVKYYSTDTRSQKNKYSTPSKTTTSPWSPLKPAQGRPPVSCLALRDTAVPHTGWIHHRREEDRGGVAAQDSSNFFGEASGIGIGVFQPRGSTQGAIQCVCEREYEGGIHDWWNVGSIALQ